MSAKGGHEVSRAVEHGVDIYTLRAGEARARVAPAWGANLFCWSDGAAILEPVPLDEVARKPTSYGIPLLLPFPNRVAGGAFTFAGRRYEVDPPRHGFVRARPWAVQDCGASDDGGAWIRCAIDTADFPELAAQYPSTLRAVVSHRLRDRTLNLHVDATNTGDQVMPFGFGIHPYFRRPDRGTLEVPAARRWQLADSLPTGERVEVDPATDLREPRPVSDLQLDDIYTDLATGDDGRVRCVLADPDAGQRTVIEADGAMFPHSVIYRAPAPRSAICIEPYTCPTDAFNLATRGVEAHIIELAAAETIELDIWIRVESI
jgi:aldose 1-epimerase